ncbi:MAG: hypothetical protein ACRC8Q_09210, partial [Aeromonas sp.]
VVFICGAGRRDGDSGFGTCDSGNVFVHTTTNIPNTEIGDSGNVFVLPTTNILNPEIGDSGYQSAFPITYSPFPINESRIPSHQSRTPSPDLKGKQQVTDG